MTLDQFVEQIENSQNDCIISQILEYLIDMQRSVQIKDTQVQEILGQLILRKYQLRQEEEDRLASSYEKKLEELVGLVEQLERKIKSLDEENSFKIDMLEKYSETQQFEGRELQSKVREPQERRADTGVQTRNLSLARRKRAATRRSSPVHKTSTKTCTKRKELKQTSSKRSSRSTLRKRASSFGKPGRSTL